MSRRAAVAVAILALLLPALPAGEPDAKPKPTKPVEQMTLDECEAAGICPVRRVPSKLIYHVTFAGKTYHLCCRTCRKSFADDPGAYGVPGHAPKPKATAPAGPVAAKPLSEADRHFVDKVFPILDRACLACHSQAKVRGGLRLDSLAALLKGGDNGPAAIAGDPANSKLIEAVRYTNPDLQMPPKNQRLPAADIAILARWVEQGMPWPAGTGVMTDRKK